MKINCSLFYGCYLHLLFVIIILQFLCGYFFSSLSSFFSFSFSPFLCLSPCLGFIELFSESVRVFNKLCRPITGVNMSLLLIYPNMRILWSPNLMEEVFLITFPWHFQPIVPLVIIKFKILLVWVANAFKAKETTVFYLFF